VNIYIHALQVCGSNDIGIPELSQYYIAKFVDLTFDRLLDSHKKQNKKNRRNYNIVREDAVLCVRMELSTMIYGKSFEALDKADHMFFGTHPGRDLKFNKARYQYMRR
jgi:hypothetical protein